MDTFNIQLNENPALKPIMPLLVLPTVINRTYAEPQELVFLKEFEGAKMCEQMRKLEKDSKYMDLTKENTMIRNSIRHINYIIKAGTIKTKEKLNEITMGGILDMQNNSYFTPRPIVDFMTDLVIKDLNLPKDALILEPSCGNGAFIRPFVEAGFTNIAGLEHDTLTYLISSFTNADILQTPFNQLQNNQNKGVLYNSKSFGDAKANTFDVVIGNPPFSRVLENLNGKNLILTDFFIAKSIECLKENGISIQIVSHKIMEKPMNHPSGNRYGSEIKEYLANETELLGAVRVPPVFYNTNIVTDILVFRKCMMHEHGKMDKSWAECQKVLIDNTNPNNLKDISSISIRNKIAQRGGHSEYFTSDYFAKRPQNIMGVNSFKDNRYCKEYWNLSYQQKKSLEIGVKSTPEYTKTITNANGKELPCFEFEKYVKDKQLTLKQFLHGDLSKVFKTPTQEQSKGKGR